MSATRKRTRTNAQLTPKRVRELALSFPETAEGSHMSHPDFRVRNKIFAALNADETMVNVKIDPASLDALVRSDPDVYRDVWAGRWVGMPIARVDANALRNLLEDAWCLTAPKALLKQYQRRAE
jgi:hypothetical protein